MQATSNGLMIQSGISEKLGLFVQSVSTFVAAFVVAFIAQWKLTLILFCIIPTVMLIVGGAGAYDFMNNSKLLKVYADAASYSENILGAVGTIKAFSLQTRILKRYDGQLNMALKLGNKRSNCTGIQFGGMYCVIYAGMSLAFWQGFKMIARGKANLGTVFTYVSYPARAICFWTELTH